MSELENMEELYPDIYTFHDYLVDNKFATHQELSSKHWEHYYYLYYDDYKKDYENYCIKNNYEFEVIKLK